MVPLWAFKSGSPTTCVIIADTVRQEEIWTPREIEPLFVVQSNGFFILLKTSQGNGFPENRKMLILKKCRSFQIPSQKRSHLKKAKPGDLSLCLPFNTRVWGKISSWEYLRPKFRGGKIFAFLSCYLSAFGGPETSQRVQPLFQGVLHPFTHDPNVCFGVFFQSPTSQI